ncbi:MAG: hypothetical protein IKE69_01920 [Thermoguttaceae bacterium]|nr:hypothetical protein [Thermoguttaceae bacterium]
MRKNLFFLVVFFFHLVQLPLSGEVAYAEYDLQCVLDAWNKYAEFFTHCGGKAVTYGKWYDEKGNVTEECVKTTDLICDYPNVVNTFCKNQEKPYICGFNECYAFEIEEETKDVYSISRVNKADETPNPFTWHYKDWEEGGSRLYSLKDSIVGTIAPSLYAFNIPLPSLFTLPEFEITEWEKLDESGVNKVRMAFTFSPETYSPFEPVRKGILFLLPDSCWLPERVEFFLTDEEEHDLGKATLVKTSSFEYQYENAMPLIKKEKYESREAGKLLYDAVTDYDLKYVKHGKYPKKRFTLSYYGLPEPDFVEKKFTPFRIFMFVIGLGFILLSVYQLRRNWRRYQSHAE